MKLTVQVSALELVRERMGAPLSSWTPRSKPRVEWKPFEKEIAFSEIHPLGGVGPLVHQGQQVILYIKNTRRDRQTLLSEPIKSPRFHIAECRTIEDMRRENRFQRYVVTNRTEGIFKVEATDWRTREVEEIDAELYVCKNCLDRLGLENDRTNWPEFSISAFFRDHETFFCSLPRHTDITASPGGYPDNWPQIREIYKTRQSWVCEECRVNLSEKRHQALLHCHHRNGVVSDNGPENLQALCVECHDRQPGHGRYPPSEQERAILGRLRELQGIRGGAGRQTGY